MRHAEDDKLSVWVIPADPKKPMRLQEIDRNFLSMKELVGGWIEIVRTDLMPKLPCGCRVVMIVDEEGVLKARPENPRAMAYYPWASIVGDVFLVGEGTVQFSDGSLDMDLISLPPEFEDWQGPGHDVPSPH